VKPNVELVGVQAKSLAAVKAAFEGSKGKSGGATLAGRDRVKQPSERNIAIIKEHVSRIEAVSVKRRLKKAVFEFLSAEKLAVEGAAAAALAVVMNDPGVFLGKKGRACRFGGNIDSRMLSTLIMRGMVRDGRITRLGLKSTTRRANWLILPASSANRALICH